MGAQCIKKLPVTVLMLTCEHQRHYSPSTSRRICSSFFCFCGCCNSASARRVRIFCIRWSRSALICAHSLSSCARRSVSSAGTFFCTALCAPDSPRNPWQWCEAVLQLSFPVSHSVKNRYCNDQMQATVSVFLRMLDVIFLFDQTDIILLKQAVRQ